MESSVLQPLSDNPDDVAGSSATQAETDLPSLQEEEKTGNADSSIENKPNNERAKATTGSTRKQEPVDEEEWQQENAPSPSPSPREEFARHNSAAFSESSKDLLNVKTHELRIKVAPNETNQNILDVAEGAIVSSPVLEGRTIHREAMRCVVEVGLRPVTIEIAISQELDRCVVIRAYEPVPEHLFNTLRDSFAKQVQLPARVQNSLAGVEEEHEEAIEGPSVTSMLDADYVSLLKKEMRSRAERDLTAFATPLERRAKDD